MKLKARDIDAFLKAPDDSVRAVLLFGPDAGRAALYARRVARAVVEDPQDPFRVRRLPMDELARAPEQLAMEAGQIPLGGGRVVVRVPDATDAATPALQMLLDAGAVNGIAVLEAGTLTPRSRLRRLAERDKGAAALGCYADTPDARARLLRTRAQSAGLRIAPDAVALFVSRASEDSGVNARETDKLLLYKGTKDGDTITSDDVAAATGDSAHSGLEDIAYATANGNPTEAMRAWARMAGQGIAPIAVLTMLARHFRRLHLTSARIAEGATPQAAVAMLKPPVHFRREADFMRQCRLWSPTAAARALNALWAANAACRETGTPVMARSAQAVLALSARGARQSRRL